jgi:hypothetical protein
MDVRRQGQPGEHAYAEQPAVASRNNAMGGGSSIKVTLMALACAVAIVVLAWFALQAFGFLTQDASVKSNEYQAVFLTNGQVYFGKFSHTDSDYVKLTDIFYLQVQQSVQPSSSSSSSQNPQVSLAKLGGELHGPEDVMYIAKSQVLFWENLKTSGKVSQAIAKYNSSGSH